MAEINVTPFVDVMLVLLVIFMVTAPLLATGVPVELPESRANAIEQDQEQISISIDQAGAIYIDDRAIASGTLAQELEALGNPAQLPGIVLRGDRALPYAQVMAVMGELNRAGFRSISLVTSSSDNSP